MLITRIKKSYQERYDHNSKLDKCISVKADNWNTLYIPWNCNAMFSSPSCNNFMDIKLDGQIPQQLPNLDKKIRWNLGLEYYLEHIVDVPVKDENKIFL